MGTSPYQLEDMARMAMGDVDGGDAVSPAPPVRSGKSYWLWALAVGTLCAAVVYGLMV